MSNADLIQGKVLAQQAEANRSRKDEHAIFEDEVMHGELMGFAKCHACGEFNTVYADIFCEKYLCPKCWGPHKSQRARDHTLTRDKP